ncbi:MAG: hypothetical protein IT207_01055 [Fimbriimonadaceae bacterium]|nr:hypothetical protein [Fimbriimonadaceae bacterium]
MNPKRACLITVVTLFALDAAAQITPGQVDDFEDGTVMNWAGGDFPVNMPDGGPNGTGDNFLQLSSDGGPFSGGKLAAYNLTQWAGDWGGVGVESVSGFFRNLGATDIHLRLVLFDSGIPQSRWTSNSAQILAVGSGWVELTFSVLEADLTRVQGTGSYAVLIGNVDRLMFRHQSGPPAAGGQSTVATLGMDVIRAIGPETVVPTGFQTVFGRLDAGNLASLFSDDDDYLRHCKFIVPNTTVPPIQVMVNGTTTKTSSTGIAATLRGRMATVGAFSVTLEQRNAVSGAFEDGTTAAVNTNESTVTSNSTGNHSEKIGSGGSLTARYSLRQTGPSAVSLFCFNADQFGWIVR